MTSLNPPESKKATSHDNLKHYAAIAASIAAIITASFSYLNGQEVDKKNTQVSKESYEALSEMVKELSEQSVKHHQDMISLRAYLKGLNDSKSNSFTIEEYQISTNSTPKPRTVSRKPVYVSGSSGAPKPADMPPPMPPALPDAPPEPKRVVPPDFNSIGSKR